MKDKKTKVAITTQAVIKRVVKNGTIYHNINITIGAMSFEIEPKFLNRKQRGLLFHECERLAGVEDVNKQTNKK